MDTARFLKYVWLFYNIMHERVKEQHTLWQDLPGKSTRLNYIYSLFHQWISNNHYTVLEIQFRFVKCTTVTRIYKNFEQLFIPSKRYGTITGVDVNKPLQKVFKPVYTVHTYSNCMIHQ